MNKKNPCNDAVPPQDVDAFNEFTGQADFARPGDTARDMAKAREAYTLHDADLPPYDPDMAGAVGGLFAEETDAPDADADTTASIDSVTDEELFVICQARFCSSCPVKKEADDIRLRSIAELDNARKRLEREKGECRRFAAEAVLQDILPAIDNLDLALQHAPTDDASKNFTIGVDLTKKMLLDSVAKHGLKTVGLVGEAFDPAVHEAMGMEQTDAVPASHVSQVLSCGYVLHDRLLRPAKVMVAQK